MAVINLKSLSSPRLNWIDWMKALGMYLIVAGHFFSVGDKYLYAFSVPVFFVISGFLNKRETDICTFFKKIIFNLFIPMCVFAFVNYSWASLIALRAGTFDIAGFLTFIKGVICGSQADIGCCWFLYTLIVLKILAQTPPPRFWNLIGFCLLLTVFIVAIWLSIHQIYLRNALVNVVVAYPFFLFGLCMQRFKEQLNSKPHFWKTMTFLIACALTIVLCVEFNGYVWVYENGYGNNYLLYLLGGFAGTCCLYGVSILLNDFRFGAVVTISKGTIVVLGLHIYIINFIKLGTFVDYLTALLLTLLFIPIIRIIELHFPWLMGKYRAK